MVQNHPIIIAWFREAGRVLPLHQRQVPSNKGTCFSCQKLVRFGTVIDRFHRSFHPAVPFFHKIQRSEINVRCLKVVIRDGIAKFQHMHT